MNRLLATLRWIFKVGITAGLLGGVVTAALFLLAFALGQPSAAKLCAAGAAVGEALIPLTGIAVACGLFVIYLDPNEKHAFRVKEK